MSGFSAAWLALREPLDAASRADCLVVPLNQWLRVNRPADSPLPVVDLGAGTGANLRYAAPRLGGAQEWLCIDQDPALLAAAQRLLQASDQTAFGCRVRHQALDLASQLPQVPVPRGSLLTASALLDLVSERWLRELVQVAVAAGAPVWFALTYDGRGRCRPAEPEDGEILDLVNRHQLTDKGFGAALGPAAAQLAEELFAEAGYRTCRASSDWQVGPECTALQQVLLRGWADAALQIAPHEARRVRDWLARRLAHVADGRSAVTVGHADLIGLP